MTSQKPSPVHPSDATTPEAGPPTGKCIELAAIELPAWLFEHQELLIAQAREEGKDALADEMEVDLRVEKTAARVALAFVDEAAKALEHLDRPAPALAVLGDRLRTRIAKRRASLEAEIQDHRANRVPLPSVDDAVKLDTTEAAAELIRALALLRGARKFIREACDAFDQQGPTRKAEVLAELPAAARIAVGEVLA